MSDRNKVLKGLECCSQMSGYVCQKCPYASDCNDLSAGIPHLASDALALLKEQQETIASLQGTIYKLNAALEKQPEIIQCEDCQCMPTSPHKPSCWKNRRRGDDENWFCANGERQ